jgi:hypothetical protein
MDGLGRAVLLSGLIGSAACGGKAIEHAEQADTPDAERLQNWCNSKLRPPRFSVEPACASFVPTIPPPELELVARERVERGDPAPWFDHRFVAPADRFGCGFALTAEIHALTFGSVGDQFGASVWWSQGQGGLSVLALVLRSPDASFALGVAVTGSGAELKSLLPFDLALPSGDCAPGPDAPSTPALFKGSVPFRCSVDDVDPMLERCELDDDVLRIVPYFTPLELKPAVLLGDAELLSPMQR